MYVNTADRLEVVSKICMISGSLDEVIYQVGLIIRLDRLWLKQDEGVKRESMDFTEFVKLSGLYFTEYTGL